MALDLWVGEAGDFACDGRVLFVTGDLYESFRTAATGGSCHLVLLGLDDHRIEANGAMKSIVEVLERFGKDHPSGRPLRRLTVVLREVDRYRELRQAMSEVLPEDEDAPK